MSEAMEKELFEYKTSGYNKSSEDDFVAPKELTVCITLSEYRGLLKTAATTQYLIDTANKDKYSREQKITELNKSIDELKLENAELKAQLYEIQKTSVEESADEV